MNRSWTDADLGHMLADMVDATQKILGANWTELRPFVERESRHILENISHIAELKEKGIVDEERAILQMDIQREAYTTLLLTVRGVKRIQAENAVNAALDVIRGTVNRLLGWSLL